MLVLCVLIFRQGSVEAARVLPEVDPADANHLAMYSSVYEKAKSVMDCWIGRLTSGPSPSGPGH